jgi:hypothetical protein
MTSEESIEQAERELAEVKGLVDEQYGLVMRLKRIGADTQESVRLLIDLLELLQTREQRLAQARIHHRRLSPSPEGHRMRAPTERDQCQAKLDILVEGFMGDDWDAYREAVVWLHDFADQINTERDRVMRGGRWFTPQTIAPHRSR